MANLRTPLRNLFDNILFFKVMTTLAILMMLKMILPVKTFQLQKPLREITYLLSDLRIQKITNLCLVHKKGLHHLFLDA